MRMTAGHWLLSLFTCVALLMAGVHGAAMALAGAGWLTWRARSLPCPIDPAAARACVRLRTISAKMLGFSALVWAAGFFFAFLAADLLL
jgi:hypothetical protein